MQLELQIAERELRVVVEHRPHLPRFEAAEGGVGVRFPAEFQTARELDEDPRRGVVNDEVDADQGSFDGFLLGQIDLPLQRVFEQRRAHFQSSELRGGRAGRPAFGFLDRADPDLRGRARLLAVRRRRRQRQPRRERHDGILDLRLRETVRVFVLGDAKIDFESRRGIRRGRFRRDFERRAEVQRRATFQFHRVVFRRERDDRQRIFPRVCADRQSLR